MPGAIAVVQSRAQRAPVVPRALLKKERLTFLERVSLWWQLWATAAFCILLFIGIIAAANGSGGAGATLISLASIGIIVSLIWLGVQEDGEPWDIGVKRRAFLMDRERKHVPHASDRLKRAKDVNYTQFSVWVRREGHVIRVGLTSHRKYGDGTQSWLADHILGYHPWRLHERERYRFNANLGEWAIDGGTDIRITEPTLERVDEAMQVMYGIARDLEINSYEEALGERRLDHVVLMHMPPPAGSRDRRAYDRAQKRFEETK